MIAPTAPLARLLRASVVGAAVTAIAVGAHLLGHGAAPHVLALVPVAVAVAALVALFSGVQWRPLALVAVIGSAQVFVHALSAYLTGDEHLTVTMVLAHAVATAGTALLLAYGERLWWRVWRWATRALTELGAVAVLPVTALDRLDRTDRVVPVGCHPRVIARRGPPLR